MKAVLLSINPKWCELIASEKKTLEVRKTRPKIETPFKCYIYCTKPKQILRYVWGKEDYAGYGESYTQMRDNEKVFCKIPDGSSPFCSAPYNGNVIGEFVCDGICLFRPRKDSTSMTLSMTRFYDLREACLSVEQILEYLDGKDGYGWHISELKIYVEPKELCCFYRYLPEKILKTGNYGCRADGLCLDFPEGGDDCSDCAYGGRVYLERPPQSWCYVEELSRKR